MANHDYHKNRGYDGYAVVGYSATSERYMASTEEVLTMSGYPVRPNLHGQIWPRSSTLLQPKMTDEYSHSPKFAHTNGSPHDSPRKAFHRTSSPPKGQYTGKYGTHLVNPDDYPRSSKFKHSNNDLPRKTTFHGVNSPPTGPYSPPGGHYSNRPNPNSPHDSPRKNFRDNRGGFSSNEDDGSDEDGECRDGICYPTKKYDADGRQGYDYDKEKKKGNGYAPGNYPVLHTTDQRPREDPRHQKSDGKKYYSSEKQPEGNNIYDSHLYNTPAHTKPMTGAQHYNSENEPYAVPAPIKTRPEGHDGGENDRHSPLSAVAHWTPFAESPRRGNQGRLETIDSAEVQRRYGNAPQYRPAASDRRFAIDSKTAAAKYGGVFVN